MYHSREDLAKHVEILAQWAASIYITFPSQQARIYLLQIKRKLPRLDTEVAHKREISQEIDKLLAELSTISSTRDKRVIFAERLVILMNKIKP